MKDQEKSYGTCMFLCILEVTNFASWQKISAFYALMAGFFFCFLFWVTYSWHYAANEHNECPYLGVDNVKFNLFRDIIFFSITSLNYALYMFLSIIELTLFVLYSNINIILWNCIIDRPLLQLICDLSYRRFN